MSGGTIHVFFPGDSLWCLSRWLFLGTLHDACFWDNLWRLFQGQSLTLILGTIHDTCSEDNPWRLFRGQSMLLVPVTVHDTCSRDSPWRLFQGQSMMLVPRTVHNAHSGDSGPCPNLLTVSIYWHPNWYPNLLTTSKSIDVVPIYGANLLTTCCNLRSQSIDNLIF